MIYRPYECGGFGEEQGCGHKQKPCCCCFPFCCQPFPGMPGYPPMPPQPPVTAPLSILTAANTAEQTIAEGGTLPFALNTVSYGADIVHTPGTAVFTITTPGVYYVSFHAVVSPPEGTQLSDPVELELTLNGTAVPGAASSQTFTASDEVATLSFNTAITVTTVPATLSISAPGISVTVTDSALTIQRLGAIPRTSTQA